ncbi:DASH family cryptochrome [Spongiibacter taiwanensis]
MRRGIFWFGNDLRLHDQTALRALACRVDELICVFCLDPALLQSRPEILGHAPASPHRMAFLQQSLGDLNGNLAELDQHLLICQREPVAALSQLISQFEVSEVARSRHPGVYEQAQWQALQKQFPHCHFQEADSRTLFSTDTLPFSWKELPSTFSQFRRAVENLTVPQPLPAPQTLPPPPSPLPSALALTNLKSTLQLALPSPPALPDDSEAERFIGGEQAGLQHLHHYFHSAWPGKYKALRNDLDQWHHSTKFSPWLALGCVSPRQIVMRLREYESREGASDSSYWIYFELLWREFFQWHAHQHGAKLFRFQGLRGKRPLTSFYPDRFRAWCEGTTPWPIVNACMHQLRETGFMSNRGRQLVASCFVHELQLDWRYGAAYFEQHLIDYDMASNWGNWQYLAGVGADPRGHRRFDLDKQARQYDPNGDFVRRWRGEASVAHMDSQDMVGWPSEGG